MQQDRTAGRAGLQLAGEQGASQPTATSVRGSDSSATGAGHRVVHDNTWVGTAKEGRVAAGEGWNSRVEIGR